MSPAGVVDMDQIDIVPFVTSATVDARLDAEQPFLWVNEGENLHLTNLADHLNGSHDLHDSTDQLNTAAFEPLSSQLFVAGFPVGTDTGLFRELVLRMNTSVKCEHVSPTVFPSSCFGKNPFNISYTKYQQSGTQPF